MFDEAGNYDQQNAARLHRASEESGIQMTPQNSGVHLPPVGSRSQQSIASFTQPQPQPAARIVNSNPDVHENTERQSRAQCMSPNTAMKLYMNKLTTYEHHEIFNFQQVFFVGANAKKRVGVLGGPENCGYDDGTSGYIAVAHDQIAYRYEVLKVLGKGSFGQVLKCYDHKAQQHVAVKLVRNEKRFTRQAAEEIRILEAMRKQDKDGTHNLVHMFDSFTFRNHVCITFELLSMNLYELIKKNKFQGFSLQLVRKFAHAILQCLDLLYRYVLCTESRLCSATTSQ
jgi:dual specificity tyrosine-phosphorylation-regulated kinase 2/3/4